MNVTLEDVLFLTHLPIKGIPLVPEVSRDRRPCSLGLISYLIRSDQINQIRLNQIRSDQTNDFLDLKNGAENLLSALANLRVICADGSREDDTRIKAIWLLIVSCIIAPDDSGSYRSTSYVQFVDDLDNVDKYAWGAAMLAFLYQGLMQWKNKDKAIDDFTWLIMGFFFYHFKGLYEIFGIAQEQQPEMPLLASLIKNLAKVEANELLEPPKEDTALPITWHPYHPSLLPSHLVYQIWHRTVVAPMFCYNYVEYHFPHNVAKQFESLQDIDLSGVGSNLHPIVIKENKGRFELNFKKHYENNIKDWVEATPIGYEEDASSARYEEDSSSARREEDASSARYEEDSSSARIPVNEGNTFQ
ncbi:Protein MAIN-LIKE 1 [Bienertia sinuspersici]